MRLSLFYVLLLGATCTYNEFRAIKEWGLLDFRELFLDVLLVIFSIVTIVCLFKNYRKFTLTQRSAAFLPSAMGILFLLLIFGHRYVRALNDKGATAFETYLDTDHESLQFDFKKNGHLKGKAVGKFSSTYYWGSYKKVGDTLTLDIKTDFPLGKTAVIQGGVLRFTDPPMEFPIQQLDN